MAASDPAGWNQAKWGMSESQLLEHATKLAAPDQLGNGYVATVGVESVPVGLTDIDPKAGLKSVRLFPVSHSDDSELEFAAVENLLLMKYCRPWTKDVHGDIEEKTAQWTFPTTTIMLSFSNIKLIGLRMDA
ncbi:MAG: hypothetical protein ABSG65_08490 [Bryobacteraceae bacterium]